MLTFQEWRLSKEGQDAIKAIFLNFANLYPDTFQIDKKLREAYLDYQGKTNG